MVAASHNPYSSPTSLRLRTSTRFSPDSLPFVLVPPRWLIFVSVFFAVLFAAVAIAGVGLFCFTERQPLVVLLISGIFGFCAYVAATALFTSVTIDANGVYMRGLRSANYLWVEITSWHLNDRTKLLSIVDESGRQALIANLAVTRSRIPEIVKAFVHFQGESADATTALLLQTYIEEGAHCY